MEVETRPITEAEIKMLGPFTKRRKAGLWGKTYVTTPTLVATVFGDGGSLISLEPTNTRPDFYIMLAPSSIESWRDALDFISENEELIFAPIEEEFGNVDWDTYDEDWKEIDCDGSMALNIGSGYTAGHYFPFANTCQKATPPDPLDGPGLSRLLADITDGSYTAKRLKENTYHGTENSD